MPMMMPYSAGLSPRMRGNQGRREGTSPSEGSIPAYAGEPYQRAAKRAEGQVYPRVCGGTRTMPDMHDYISGLSPRMRGNPIHYTRRPARSRSIPAYAGEPACGNSDGNPYRVYPRVCGGTWISTASSPQMRGLSPRMRGNLQAVV